MTEVAGEVGDGFLCHGFTTEPYLREVTLPALERGAAKSGRTLADIEISGPAFVVTGTTEEEMAASVQGTTQQIAFYGSTPAYRPVLELHGWGGQIGRATGRDRGCQYVLIWVDAESLNKNKKQITKQ